MKEAIKVLVGVSSIILAVVEVLKQVDELTQESEKALEKKKEENNSNTDEKED